MFVILLLNIGNAGEEYYTLVDFDGLTLVDSDGSALVVPS